MVQFFKMYFVLPNNQHNFYHNPAKIKLLIRSFCSSTDLLIYACNASKPLVGASSTPPEVKVTNNITICYYYTHCSFVNKERICYLPEVRLKGTRSIGLKFKM
jgi:hypothetical protein